MGSLRPFFRFYGAKWRAVRAGLYPAPAHSVIYEPFAGAAGYALNHPDREVHLIERDPVIAGIWRWLIHTTPDDVRSIPLVDSVADLPEWVPLGARDLIGFSMNAATSSPRKTLSAGARRLREHGRKFYGWTNAMRERVATQVPAIKHWYVHEGDYSLARNDRAATWFIDPPYVGAGRHYRFNHEFVSYAHLSEWCRSRSGQVIVCEQEGARWLPFRPLAVIKAGPRSRVSREAVWP